MVCEYFLAYIVLDSNRNIIWCYLQCLKDNASCGVVLVFIKRRFYPQIVFIWRHVTCLFQIHRTLFPICELNSNSA